MELGLGHEDHPAARKVRRELQPKPREVIPSLRRLSQDVFSNKGSLGKLGILRSPSSTPDQKDLLILTELANPFTKRVSPKQGRFRGQVTSAVPDEGSQDLV